MTFDEPIELKLHSRLESEKLLRTILKCNDIDILRQIAIELLKLQDKKTAIAYWATRRAAEAEVRGISKQNISKPKNY